MGGGRRLRAGSIRVRMGGNSTTGEAQGVLCDFGEGACEREWEQEREREGGRASGSMR